MNKVILSLTILVSLVYSQELITKTDILSGILIDVPLKGASMQLENGNYEDTADESDLSYSLNQIVFSSDNTSAALTIIEFSGGSGNGAMQRIGYATKTKGKTYIRMGGNCAGKWATIKDFSFNKTVKMIVKDGTFYTTNRSAEAQLVYNIINNVPVLDNNKSHLLN